ncbi:MAG: hypothetical protein QW041_03355 [Candidatus Pacearchaeota archaeon]
MDSSEFIKKIEKLITEKYNPVILLDKKDPFVLIKKGIIESCYGSNIEIKEDNEVYHIHFIGYQKK